MNNPKDTLRTKPVLQTVLVAVLVVILVGTVVALAWVSRSVSGTSFASSANNLATSANTRIVPTAFQPLDTSTITPTITLKPTSTITRTITSFPTSTSTNTLIPPTDIPTFDGTLPSTVQIDGLVGHAQLYSLDCEARSAVDWADFFGYSIDENDFLDKLPKSDNPDVGFVGEFWGAQGQIPPDSYGVHADPIAALLRAYGVPAKAVHGMTYEQLQAELAAGRPVITWVIFLVRDGTPIEYTASDGVTTTVANYEHTIIITGYDADRVALVDGSYFYHRTIDQFLSSWSVLGNMAIIFSN